MLLPRSLRRNTLLLTAASLLGRLLGVLWQGWLARRLGSAGLGTWQLMGSVSFLFATVAVSGIRYTVTRLLSEELGRGRTGSVAAVMERAGAWALCFGCAALAGLWFSADVIARGWLRESAAAPALRWAAFALPFTALGAVLAGYFTAVGRVGRSAAVQLAEPLLRLAFSELCLRALPGPVLPRLSLAGTGAEAACTALLGLLYVLDRRGRTPGERGGALTGRMLRLAAPLAVSAYARSGLGTVRNLLIPRALGRAGLSAASALAGYGLISGLALPALFFPACLPAALSELLVPELTRAQARGDWPRLRRMARGLLGRTLALSGVLAALYFLLADAVGTALCRSRECVPYLRQLAGLVPLAYTDIVTDGCLKGLGEMNRSMLYNVAESVLGLILLWTLLPRYGLAGYVFVLYACEVFNFSLSVHRLWVVLRSGGSRRSRPQ